MNQDPSTLIIPTEPGTPFEGGFYAGRFRVGEQVFALIVSPKAEGESEPEPWLATGSEVPGAATFSDGLANTDAMAAAKSRLAASIRELSIGGFTDWYLPSRDELELMYRTLKPTAEKNYVWRHGDNPSSLPPGYPYSESSPVQTPATAFQAGGAEAFEPDWYWSSTQYSRAYAWGQYFVDGYQTLGDKSYEGRARAVRRFSL